LPSVPPAANPASADAALLARVAARDAEALCELYDRHSRLMFGLILRILKNRDEAEEVLQEVFIQAWTRAATYHADLGAPLGWLIGIARNRAIDRLRANARRLDIVDAASAQPAAETTPDPIGAGAQQLDVQRALDLLPPEQRDLIEQAYFLGFTHSELSERLGLPLGTVKTRIRTGVLALRGHLEGKYIEQ
jgi:RNA polymerase sigma-70 factor, ECF subfamily